MTQSITQEMASRQVTLKNRLSDLIVEQAGDIIKVKARHHRIAKINLSHDIDREFGLVPGDFILSSKTSQLILVVGFGSDKIYAYRLWVLSERDDSLVFWSHGKDFANQGFEKISSEITET